MFYAQLAGIPTRCSRVLKEAVRWAGARMWNVQTPAFSRWQPSACLLWLRGLLPRSCELFLSSEIPRLWEVFKIPSAQRLSKWPLPRIRHKLQNLFLKHSRESSYVHHRLRATVLEWFLEHLWELVRWFESLEEHQFTVLSFRAFKGPVAQQALPIRAWTAWRSCRNGTQCKNNTRMEDEHSLYCTCMGLWLPISTPSPLLLQKP